MRATSSSTSIASARFKASPDDSEQRLSPLVRELAFPAEIESTADRWSAELGGIRLEAGRGSIDSVGAWAGKMGESRALLVTDRGLERAGHADRLQRSLETAGFDVRRLADVRENPTAADIEWGAETARDFAANLLVALGGGSAMDSTKGINFLLTNGGRIEDYWGYGKASKPMLPMIAVPTTCGTGSDAQSYAVLSQAGTHRKMACGDPKARFRLVVLDPELAVSAPSGVRVTAGLDAISHAVESRVSTKHNPASDALAQRAFALLDGSIEAATADSPAVESLGRMQLGAHLAGAAIELSMLGAAHAAANPLTARCRIPHGEAVALMLPHVIRFNAEAAEAGYRGLHHDGALALADRVESLKRLGALANSLQERGVPRDTLRELARLASEEWTASFNPRPVVEDDFLELYRAAYD